MGYAWAAHDGASVSPGRACLPTGGYVAVLGVQSAHLVGEGEGIALRLRGAARGGLGGSQGVRHTHRRRGGRREGHDSARAGGLGLPGLPSGQLQGLLVGDLLALAHGISEIVGLDNPLKVLVHLLHHQGDLGVVDDVGLADDGQRTASHSQTALRLRDSAVALRRLGRLLLGADLVGLVDGNGRPEILQLLLGVDRIRVRGIGDVIREEVDALPDSEVLLNVLALEAEAPTQGGLQPGADGLEHLLGLASRADAVDMVEAVDVLRVLGGPPLALLQRLLGDASPIGRVDADRLDRGQLEVDHDGETRAAIPDHVVLVDVDRVQLTRIRDRLSERLEGRAVRVGHRRVPRQLDLGGRLGDGDRQVDLLADHGGGGGSGQAHGLSFQ